MEVVFPCGLVSTILVSKWGKGNRNAPQPTACAPTDAAHCTISLHHHQHKLLVHIQSTATWIPFLPPANP